MSCMNPWQKFARAFTIFAFYEYDGTCVVSEHDEIFAGPNPSAVSQADSEELIDLGWRPHVGLKCWHTYP